MRLSKRKLKRIIREETQKAMSEVKNIDVPEAGRDILRRMGFGPRNVKNIEYSGAKGVYEMTIDTDIIFLESGDFEFLSNTSVKTVRLDGRTNELKISFRP